MTKESGIHAAAKKISDRFQYFQEQQIPVLFLVSGGSALEILNHIDTAVINTFLTLGVLDERFSQDPTINNFAQFMKTKLYTDAKAAGCDFIDTRVQFHEVIDELALRFEKELEAWRSRNPNGVVFITQGMGQDGHTSGIMPFPENPTLFHQLFEQEQQLVVGYDAGDKNQFPLRVTTTITFLKNVDESIFFAFGEDKKKAIELINSPDVTLASTPAKIVRQMSTIYVFSDLTASFQRI